MTWLDSLVLQYVFAYTSHPTKRMDIMLMFRNEFRSWKQPIMKYFLEMKAVMLGTQFLSGECTRTRK